MTKPATERERKRWEGAEIEYSEMRKEVLARIQMRQYIITGTLTLGGALLAVGTNWPAVALLYPPLAAFLAFAWAQNDYRIRDIASYVREEVEPLVPGARWESWIRGRRSGKGLGSWRFVVVAHGGLFLFTQALAIYIGATWLVISDVTLPLREIIVGWTLVGLDLAAFITVIWILKQARR